MHNPTDQLALFYEINEMPKYCYRYSTKNEAGSLGGPFPTVEYYYIFRIKYTEAILSNSTRKLLWFEITKMLMAV